MSPEAVQLLVSGKEREWKVEYRQEMGEDAKGDNIEALGILVSPYQRLGFEGRLYLTFYGDRLSRMMFCPRDSDFPPYLSAEKREEGIPLGAQRFGMEHRGLLIWATTDRPNYYCVGWRDEEIEEPFRSD